MHLITGLLLSTFLFSAASPVAADIYRFEDEDGVVHFTDAPTDRRFKVVMRDLKLDKQLRRKFLISKTANTQEYDCLIRENSAKHGVSEALIRAVIQAESGYNSNAISRTGACGLMQLMPGTAKLLKVSNSFDPGENVNGGVKYLKFLLDTLNGDIPLALAAYNAGLSKVAKYHGVPPYAETRSYVQKVLAYMDSYAVQ